MFSNKFEEYDRFNRIEKLQQVKKTESWAVEKAKLLSKINELNNENAILRFKLKKSEMK